MLPFRPSQLLLLVVPLALGACAAAPEKPLDLSPTAVSADELPAVPVCRDEMRAFVEVTRLAKLHGDEWEVFEPAVDAMKQQILDCFDGNYPGFRALSYSRRPRLIR